MKDDEKTNNKLIFLLFNIIINALNGLYRNINVNGNKENNKLINDE